ncbi:MAG: hypothetical protein ACPGDB_00755 [Fusobacterium sp.]
MQEKASGINVKRWCYESYHYHERVRLFPYLSKQHMKCIIAGANNPEFKIHKVVREKQKPNGCLYLHKKKIVSLVINRI